jgi:hypothetical protein
LPTNTSSNAAVNLLSRSPDEEFEPGGALAEVHEQVPGLLGCPRPCGAGGNTQDVHAAGLDLHDEKDVEALEEHGVNVQEVACQDPRCLGCQELAPCR